MTLPDVLRTVRWMVRDTFRQSVASKLFWVMLAVTAVATVTCLSISVSGDERPERLDYEVPAQLPLEEVRKVGWDKLVKEGQVSGEMPPSDADPNGLREQALRRGEEEARKDGVRIATGAATFLFGAVEVPLPKNRESAVASVQLWLAGVLADTAGVLLALIWTAGFLPSFLEPQAATVLLAKPPPRWSILLGKYLGVVLFVTLQAALFIGGTWLALGLRTNVWNGTYWLAVPLLAFNFAVFYAVSTFLAVWTRSTVASAFGVLLFWLLCWTMNYSHHRMIANPTEGLTPAALLLAELGYWLLPKPFDLGGVFFDAMRAENWVMKPPELTAVQDAGRFFPELSALASATFALLTLGLAAYEFEMTDY